jgi:hypothetical protein
MASEPVEDPALTLPGEREIDGRLVSAGHTP